MWKRMVLSVGAFGLLMLPTHGRLVSAAPDHPIEGVWQVEQTGRPFAGVRQIEQKGWGPSRALGD